VPDPGPPKTRSGKMLRGMVCNVADGKN